MLAFIVSTAILLFIAAFILVVYTVGFPFIAGMLTTTAVIFYLAECDVL